MQFNCPYLIDKRRNDGVCKSSYVPVLSMFTVLFSGDALGNYTGSAFSTKDRDNDSFETYDCARAYNGSWWYGACHRSNLNGLYLKGHHESLANGVVWIPFRGWKYSLKTTEMKIRRV